MTTLLEMVRARCVEMEAAERASRPPYTDDQRARALDHLIRSAKQYGGEYAERLEKVSALDDSFRA
jgi:hypothetical protein